jgi:hypothetical protein
LRYPDFIAALAHENRRQCPCGAVAEHSYGLCKPANRHLTNDSDAPDAGEPRQPWFAGAGYTPRDYDEEGM